MSVATSSCSGSISTHGERDLDGGELTLRLINLEAAADAMKRRL